MKRVSILASISLLFFNADALSSSISVERISEQLHILSGKEYGTSIGVLVLEDGIVLVDPMPGSDNLVELDKTIRTISEKPIQFVLNTHAHSDHTGGNEYFIKKGGALVESFPKIEGLEHINVKSHSATDNIYYYKKSNVIFAGDVFDSSWHPTFYAGGTIGFSEAVDAILKLGDDETLIVPGHGSPVRKSSLVEFKKNTLLWIAKVKELHQKGWSENRIMNDIQANEILEKFNVTGKTPFIPEKAFKRFIQRTITVIDTEKKGQ